MKNVYIACMDSDLKKSLCAHETENARVTRICIEQQVPFVVAGGRVVLENPTRDRIDKLLTRGVSVLREEQVQQHACHRTCETSMH